MAKLKASIDFGLVHIPVEIVSAQDRAEHVSFKMFDSKDKSRIRLKRVNENTGREVEWGDIIKGYEVEPDHYIYFTQEELDALEQESNQSLEIDVFIEPEEVNPALFENPYYLVPQKGSEKGYSILEKALEKTGKYAVIQAVMRNRDHLGVIYPKDGGLALGLLRYPNEIKNPSEVIPDAVQNAKVSEKEVSMAEKLIKEMTGKFKPTKYKDEYQEKLQAAIKKKAKNKTYKIEAKPESKAKEKKTIDIMDLLEKSLKSPKAKKTKTKKRA